MPQSVKLLANFMGNAERNYLFPILFTYLSQSGEKLSKINLPYHSPFPKKLLLINSFFLLMSQEVSSKYTRSKQWKSNTLLLIMQHIKWPCMGIKLLFANPITIKTAYYKPKIIFLTKSTAKGSTTSILHNALLHY